MQKIILAVVLLFLASTGWAAEVNKVPYFQNCSALNTAEFSLLSKYLESTEDGSKVSQLCFKLSNKEFIYTTDFNVFYCTFEPQAKCREYDEGRQYRNIGVVREFAGPNGKRFVLLSSGLLSHGISSEEYEVFFLKPRAPDGIPFVIQDLVGASRNYSESGQASLCEKGDLNTRVADERNQILGYSIQNEGTADVRLEFKTVTEDCDTGKKTTQMHAYGYNKTGFVDASPNSATKPAAPRLSSPHGLAVDSKGNAYVIHSDAGTILKIAPNGNLSTFAGGNKGFMDGVGTSAMLNRPLNLAIDASDNLYVSDIGNRAIRKITPSGEVSTIARDIEAEVIAVDSKGNIIAACEDNTVRRIRPDGVVMTLARGGNVRVSHFVSIDSVGNAYFSMVDKILKVTPIGVVTEFFSIGDSRDRFAESISDERTTGKPVDINGIAFGKGDILYFSDSFGIFKKVLGESVKLVTGFKRKGFTDGQLDVAEFNYLENVIVDRAGNLYVLDGGNEAIRKVSPDGKVTTVAARRKPSKK